MAPEELPSHLSPGVDRSEAYKLFDKLDNFSGLRNMLREVADRDGEWAGIPMPLDEKRLTIHPKYPHAAALCDMGITDKQRSEEAEKDADIKAKFGDFKIRNTFWSYNRKAEVVVAQDPDGKVRHYLYHGKPAAGRIFDTMYCSDAWGIEQESRAVHTLGTLISHRMFKSYLLTGNFMETSKRTGLCYIFRRLRPTIVLDMKHPDGDVRIRCTICMHPIGYYSDSWAGAMCPSDDVIAHLMMMRGDEPMLWRRGNQHPPYRPESGL